MGPRPVFDFPDEVTIQKTPLKVENFVYVTVHNIGTVPAGFTLITKRYLLLTIKNHTTESNK